MEQLYLLKSVVLLPSISDRLSQAIAGGATQVRHHVPWLPSPRMVIPGVLTRDGRYLPKWGFESAVSSMAMPQRRLMPFEGQKSTWDNLSLTSAILDVPRLTVQHEVARPATTFTPERFECVSAHSYPLNSQLTLLSASVSRHRSGRCNKSKTCPPAYACDF